MIVHHISNLCHKLFLSNQLDIHHYTVLSSCHISQVQNSFCYTCPGNCSQSDRLDRLQYFHKGRIRTCYNVNQLEKEMYCLQKCCVSFFRFKDEVLVDSLAYPHPPNNNINYAVLYISEKRLIVNSELREHQQSDYSHQFIKRAISLLLIDKIMRN